MVLSWRLRRAGSLQKCITLICGEVLIDEDLEFLSLYPYFFLTFLVNPQYVLLYLKVLELHSFHLYVRFWFGI